MDLGATLGSGPVRASRACAVGLGAIFDAGRDECGVADLGNSRRWRHVKLGQEGQRDVGTGRPHLFSNVLLTKCVYAHEVQQF